MADVLKVLAQSNPVAATLTDAYTVPASTSAVVDVLACNRGAATDFRVSVAPAGAADDPKHYLAYNEVIIVNGRARISRITMQATDVLRVYATLATLSFSVVGIEVIG